MKKQITYFLGVPMALAFLAVTMACSNDAAVYEKADQFDGVRVKIKIDKLSKKELMGEIYSFVYFEYTIQNKHPDKLVFHPGHIKVLYNGRQNNSVEYDSMASAMTEAEVLAKGVAVYKLYLVFKQPDIDKTITDFEIRHTGIQLDDGG